MKNLNTALFLDLGGTLVKIENDAIYVSPEGTPEILPNVVEVLNQAPEDLIFVVTNQSGIGKALISHGDVSSWVSFVFKDSGRFASDFWACPTEDSKYRKPSPLMVRALGDKHFVDLSQSTFVGDSHSDRECADSAEIGSFVWAKDYFRWS